MKKKLKRKKKDFSVLITKLSEFIAGFYVNPPKL